MGGQNRKYRNKKRVKKRTSRFGLAINPTKGHDFRLTVDETAIS